MKNFWPLPRSLAIQTKLPEGRKEEVRKQKGEEQREEFEEDEKKGEDFCELDYDYSDVQSAATF